VRRPRNDSRAGREEARAAGPAGRAGKNYGSVIALSDVSLEVNATRLLRPGDNGAGKSTLIKIIAGAAPAQRGSYEVDGAPVSFSSPRDALERASRRCTGPGGRSADACVRNFFLGNEVRKGPRMTSPS